MNELAQLDNSDKILSILVDGDLAKLSSAERVNYYNAVCHSVGLNPLTKPFQFITLNGKLTMYALKGCTDQLRAINGVSIDPPKIEVLNGWITVTVTGNDRTGRRDSEVALVSEKDMQGNYGNAMMKAVTKAKRRLTLAMCGLGMLDETEVETIPNARVYDMEKPAPSALPANASEGLIKQNATRIRKDDWQWEASKVREMNKAISDGGDDPAEVINYAYEAGVKTPEQFQRVWTFFNEQECSFRAAVDSLHKEYDPAEEAVDAEVVA
jgi:hypothetical protein